MTYSSFDQDRIWTDKYGTRYKIKKMGAGHVKNTIAMLRRHVDQYATAESLRQLAQIDHWVTSIGMGEMAEDSVTRGAAAIQADPRGWLENTPLMIELVRVDQRNERRIAREYRDA